MSRIVPALAVAAVRALAGCRSAPLHYPAGVAFAEPVHQDIQAEIGRMGAG